MFSLFNLFKGGKEADKQEVANIKVALNEEFVLKEGYGVKLGGLSIYYKNTSFPPKSYTGDKEEFIYPQIEVSENEDTLHFPINKKSSLKIFHRYQISLLEMNIEGNIRNIKLVIIPKEINTKILEEEAVRIALEEARQNNFLDGEAINRTLQLGLWIIEVSSKIIDDLYFGVEVDANTGEIRRSYTDSRA